MTELQPPIPLIDAALRGAALALLVLLAAQLLRERPGLVAVRAAALLSLGLCVQLISSTPWFEAEVALAGQAPLIAVSVGNAVLFWLFVQSLFNDEFRLRPLHGLAWLAAAGVSLFNCLLAAQGPSPLLPWTHGLQRALPLLFTLLSAAAAATHWRSDLVEKRRHLRVFVLVAGGVYALAQVVMRVASPSGGCLSSAGALIDVSGLLAMLVVLAWMLLGLRQLDVWPTPAIAPPAEPAPPAARDPAELAQGEALLARMRTERLYAAEDLSLASLAARLGLPEYRLRRLINQQLGHRNFNAFVNGLRLDEASAALADPARRELPVLSIALEAGFQSIGPFNRAFKAATGMTPGEFRRQQLAAPNSATAPPVKA